MKKNVVLVGFMGTGKSSIGKILAAKLGVPLVDVDREIEKREKIKIREIFETKGEPYFRGIEREAVKAAASGSGRVITTGGGAVVDPENFEALKANGVLVTLTADPETIYGRVKGSRRRPLLSGDDVLGDIRRLLDKRKPFYDRSDYFFKTDGRSADEVAAEIAGELKGKLE